MSLVIEALNFLFAYLIFPGLAFGIVVGLFYEGIDRKIAAHMQNRIGPPIWQPFYDAGKLLSKEDIVPEKSQNIFFNFAPLLALGSIVTAMIMIPVYATFPFLQTTADLLILIYLLNIPAVALILGGASSSTPFGTVGAERYIVQLFGYELVFIITALTAAGAANWSLNIASIVEAQGGSWQNWFIFQTPLAAIAALLVAPGKLLKTPFDIPEAETEIVGGPLTEYSGPKLAVFHIAFDIEILAVAGFIAALFLGGPTAIVIGGIAIPAVVGFLIKTLAILLLITLIRCVTARVRIHQALSFYWIYVGAFALINLIIVTIW